MTASMHGGRRATVLRATARTHAIAVSPHVRADSTKHPNAFETRLAGEVLCVTRDAAARRGAGAARTGHRAARRHDRDAARRLAR